MMGLIHAKPVFIHHRMVIEIFLGRLEVSRASPRSIIIPTQMNDTRKKNKTLRKYKKEMNKGPMAKTRC